MAETLAAEAWLQSLGGDNAAFFSDWLGTHEAFKSTHNKTKTL